MNVVRCTTQARTSVMMCGQSVNVPTPIARAQFREHSGKVFDAHVQVVKACEHIPPEDEQVFQFKHVTRECISEGTEKPIVGGLVFQTQETLGSRREMALRNRVLRGAVSRS